MQRNTREPTLITDVLVAGGGTAGFVAAIAAARTGAKVVLVEKLPVPGGTLTNGGIGFNAYYSQESEDGLSARRIVGGIAYELAQRLEQTGGATGFVRLQGDHYHIPYRFMADHEALKAVASEMLLESTVTCLLQTFVTEIEHENGVIAAAYIGNKDGRSRIVAKQYIDATGDGDLARMMGLEQKPLWQVYDKVCGGPTGLVFGINGIDFERALNENEGAFHCISSNEAVDPRLLSMHRYALIHSTNPKRYPRLNTLDINGFTSFQSLHPNEATYVNNSRGPKVDATDVAAYSKAELMMRVRIMEFANALRAEVAGFESSYLSWASVQLGVRASNITICDHMMCQEEITRATRYSDEIGLYAFHDYAPKDPTLFTDSPGFYGLPYRMLLPVGAENLLMVGRAVTYDLHAHMSTRNTVACMVMGQAAGTAAALCASGGYTTRSLPYEALRTKLVADGVIVN